MTTYNGACHCGAVRFRTKLKNGLASARRCNCSLCRMRGAIAVGAAREEFEIVEGAEQLATYTFNTGTAQHYFCSHCGIYTHHLRRSNQYEYGVNVACLEGISPFDFEEVLVIDGINHPSDDKEQKGPRIAGTLHFVRNDG